MKYEIGGKIVFIDTRGQSLMEVVVAMGVVLFVLISIVVLVLINSFGQKGSENKVIASNLAREGIETFRNLRDTAKLQKKTLTQLDSDYSLSVHYYYLDFTTTGNVWDVKQSNASWSNTQLYLVPSYPLYVPTAAGNSYTAFQRRLTIDPICSDVTRCSTGAAGICEDGEFDDCGGAGISYIGYRVASAVQWLENNQTVSISLTDFLYDWR